MSTVMPGIRRARVFATWSNVLWSSLRTITRHSPPSPLPGSRVRGISTVSLTLWNLPVLLAPVAMQPGPQRRGRHGLQERLHDARIGRAAHLLGDRTDV